MVLVMVKRGMEKTKRVVFSASIRSNLALSYESQLLSGQTQDPNICFLSSDEDLSPVERHGLSCQDTFFQVEQQLNQPCHQVFPTHCFGH